MRDFALGDVIADRYVLGRELGRGGTAVVYEAEHLFTGRTVALKIIAPDLPKSLDRELCERMLREARGLGMVRHPYVVDVLDAGMIESGVPYIAMEMLQGRTLEGILAARHRIDVDNAVAVGIQLASALAALHRRELIHRDVKPGNIFLVRDGTGATQIRLMDLGIAISSAFNTHKITARGNVVGTLEYMSMERLAGDDSIDPRVDVYAAGVTLFECIEGDVPFTGSLADVVRQVMPTDAEPARVRSTSVRPQVAAVIERACARRREDRYASMDEFRDALIDAVDGRVPTISLLDDSQSRRKSARHAASPVPPAEARRKHARAPFASPVRLSVGSESIDGRCEDISEGGMLVIARQRPPENVEVVLRFALPIEGHVVTVRAVVCWAKSSSEAAPVAIGLEFVELPAPVRASIDRYVELMSRLDI